MKIIERTNDRLIVLVSVEMKGNIGIQRNVSTKEIKKIDTTNPIQEEHIFFL